VPAQRMMIEWLADSEGQQARQLEKRWESAIWRHH